jgi:hypothetical protein
LACFVALRELVVGIPAPRRDHCENEAAALADQFSVRFGIALSDAFRNMSEIELNRPTATRFEVDEHHPARGVEQVAWVRLAMQELLGSGAPADHPATAFQRRREKLSV